MGNVSNRLRAAVVAFRSYDELAEEAEKFAFYDCYWDDPEPFPSRNANGGIFDRSIAAVVAFRGFPETATSVYEAVEEHPAQVVRRGRVPPVPSHFYPLAPDRRERWFAMFR